MITTIIAALVLIGLAIAVGASLETGRQVRIASAIAADRYAIRKEIEHLRKLRALEARLVQTR
jgi:hypothetical protein